MGKITEELKALIAKQIQDHGIVIWYDPEKDYTEVVCNLDFPDSVVLHHQGSHLDLKYRLEPYLEFIENTGQFKSDFDSTPHVLVYVPLERSETQYALIEAEVVGIIIEPGASPWQRNTRLKVITERVFKRIAPDRAGAIAAEVEAGRRTLAELDWLADQTGELGSIKLIFGTTVVADVVLGFLGSDEHDQAILEKQALTELTGLCNTDLGIDLNPNQTAEQVRRQLGQMLLLSELALKIKSAGGDISKFSGIDLPESERQREQLLFLCQQWRNRLDLQQSYAVFANRVQTDAQVIGLGLQADSLVNTETFACVESLLLSWVEGEILSGKADSALAVAANRKTSFWSLYEGEYQLRWTLLETACQLLIAADKIDSELKSINKNAVALIQAYSSGDDPWWALDRYHRHLEYRYAMLDFRTDGEHQKLEAVMRHVRSRYTEVVGKCAESLAKSIASTDFEFDDLLNQDQIYAKEVHPLTTEGKVAYFLVDALRYEMAHELVEGLGEEYSVTLSPAVAQLPTITEIGMAALMPKAEIGMDLVDVGGGRVGLEVNGTVLKDRATRIKHLEACVSEKPLVLKLNSLMKPTKKQQQEINNAKFLIVTSQEIDRHGEETDDEEEARRFMDEVLEKLRRGVRRLATMGVRHIVVAADHGFLFVDELDPAMRIDAPGGQTVDLHPRVWVGRGGAVSPSVIRMKASDVGLGGDLELAFPLGLSTFKTKGSNRGFFHGGISFQELIIPVASIKVNEILAQETGSSSVTLTFSKPKVTTRFFSVEAKYVLGSLFGDEIKRIKVSVRANKAEVGIAAMAAYGFEEGAQEIVLEKDKPNAITIMLTTETKLTMVSVHIIDAQTQMELASLKNIPVDISI